MSNWTELYAARGMRVRWALLELLNLCDRMPQDGVLSVEQIRRVVAIELHGVTPTVEGDRVPSGPNLADRLLEAIDEVEEIAQTTAGGGGMPDPVWITKPSRSRTWQILREVNDDTPIGYITDGRWEISHITRHDPAAVIRRCVADRKIVAEVRGLSDGALKDDLVASLGDLVLGLLAAGYGVSSEEADDECE